MTYDSYGKHDNQADSSTHVGILVEEKQWSAGYGTFTLASLTYA
jgi:hypothetical protein